MLFTQGKTECKPVKVFDDTLQNLQQNIGDEQIVETVVKELPMGEVITGIYKG